ncbi:hypothetical protein AB0941_39495 [Streptomyces sp. NPDC013433]|uniref:hypothetical protein n=1 Tax=Streptomyces sp. NPDC013433 TaxID=3155604 RepID=UPI0034515AA9
MEVGHLAELADPEDRCAARPRNGPGALTVLTRKKSDTAVFDALTAWSRKDLLATNPLLRSRLVAQCGGDEPVQTLRQVINEGIDTLAADPRAEKCYRAADGLPPGRSHQKGGGTPRTAVAHVPPSHGRGSQRVRSLPRDMESRPIPEPHSRP